MIVRKTRRFLDKVSRRLGLGCCFSPPNLVSIEHTTRCNLRCKTCARYAWGGEFVDMDPAVVERIQREIVPFVQVVSLSGYGEPLVNPQFPSLLDHALSLGKQVGFITNGVPLTEEIIDKLFFGGGTIHLSIDGATNETMKFLRGTTLDQMLGKMERIRKLRREHPDRRFGLFVIFVLSRSNVEELPDLIRILKRYGVDELIVQEPFMPGRDDEIARLAMAHHKDVARELLPVARRTAEECGLRMRMPSFDWLEPSPESSPSVGTPVSGGGEPLRKCFLPWREVFVDVHGNVHACCFGPAESLGNLKEKSFREIWNGEPFRRLRRTVNSPCPPEYCRICPMR
ncbi:radical SAM protein [Candidatus Sumerlaeota bacterium]|nr:radical SAM protein [Candidatus Sumerlaeota bacterium]